MTQEVHDSWELICSSPSNSRSLAEDEREGGGWRKSQAIGRFSADRRKKYRPTNPRISIIAIFIVERKKISEASFGN